MPSLSSINASRFFGESRSFSIDPSLFLKSLLEHAGDFLGGILGAALNLAFATRLPVHFHPAADDEPRRVRGGNEGGRPQCRPRRLASAGVQCCGSEFAQSLSRHLVAFDRRL